MFGYGLNLNKNFFNCRKNRMRSYLQMNLVLFETHVQFKNEKKTCILVKSDS